MGLLSRFFTRHPLVANTVSSGGLLAVGDGIQQWIEFRRGVHKEKTYNWRRTGRMLVVGLVEGPPHHWWYTGLDRLLPGRTARVVRLKILADQLVAAPLFALTFFVGMDLLEGRSVRDGLQEFKKKFPEVYLFDWCIWPPTQWLNFTYVPERYRVLYVNVVTVIWDVFLSYSKHRDQLEPERGTAVESGLGHRRPAQLRVSALQSDDTDSETMSTDSQTGSSDCARLVSEQPGDSERLAGDWSETADNGGQTEYLDVCSGDSDRTDDRSDSRHTDQAELHRRRATS
ncbi:mpv17-like protein 2 [Amphibalanus amphitrite]|uniref:mpv17-like protein 2 n=1 Tax=Amphibalanus amphitrite TaxID=1232801 RepID=UPI001C90C03A|nr:mpv17-like protein 2 [Amphibalanus amphitrite]XP_043215575.1 mpv17-like protein 2 [Amphibalanus amphitrite]XP_043215576.1 mpv17-like protein 2 [Amphibalanus amphitrite]XP_043215577.1 mpv17-like protein 2 [Amphibalanus amphitrite]